MKLLTGGTHAKCAVCDTQILVIRATAEAVELTCGGVEMIAANVAKSSVPHTEAPTQAAKVGKRYGNAADTTEMLCTKSGTGALALNGEILVVKQPKALPASD